jgi:hypothetical protein
MTPAALQGLEVAQRLNNRVQAFGIHNPGEFEEIPHNGILSAAIRYMNKQFCLSSPIPCSSPQPLSTG